MSLGKPLCCFVDEITGEHRIVKHKDDEKAIVDTVRVLGKVIVLLLKITIVFKRSLFFNALIQAHLMPRSLHCGKLALHFGTVEILSSATNLVVDMARKELYLSFGHKRICHLPKVV
jgi:hypothetical protein